MLMRVSKKFKLMTVSLIAVLSLLWFVGSYAEDSSSQSGTLLPYVELRQGNDLVADAEIAKEKQIPILMMFSMKHCPYCVEVEEDYLKPMLRNHTEYAGKVMIRKIKLDGSDVMRDFNGKIRDPNEFSDEYNVSMVPTLVLVDSKGKRLSPAIVGIRNSHYYSSELDNAIDFSLKKIREIAKR